MLIQLNRFFTTEEIRRQYRIPAEIADVVLPSLPVVELPGGTRIHLESEVDEFLIEFARRQRLAVAQTEPADNGTPGRNVETLEIALYANDLRKQRKTWKQIFRACRERWPDNKHVENVEQVRGTHRRHFPPIPK